MCLCDYKRIKPEEDITCYKVCHANRNEFFTPVRYSSYTIGRKKRLNRLAPEIHGGRDEKGVNKLWVGAGAYHTFKKFEDAEIYARFLANTYNYTAAVIIECKIPKKSKYIYEGVFNHAKCKDGTTDAGYPHPEYKYSDGYASQQLMPERVIGIYTKKTETICV